MKGWIHARARFGSGPELNNRVPITIRPNMMSDMVFCMEPIKMPLGEFSICSLPPQVQLIVYSSLIRYEQNFISALESFEFLEFEPLERTRLANILEFIVTNHPILLASKLGLKDFGILLDRMTINNVLDKLAKTDISFRYVT